MHMCVDYLRFGRIGEGEGEEDGVDCAKGDIIIRTYKVLRDNKIKS